MANSILNDIRNIFSSNQYLKQIMIVNAFVFVVLNILRVALPLDTANYIIGFLSLSTDITHTYWQIWTPVTYMFTHLGLWHVGMNMLLLYMIGGILEDLYGRKQLLLTFLFGGIFSGLFYLVFELGLGETNSPHQLIGASGGVTAVMIAIGFLQPNYTIRLALIGPLALKWFVLVSFIISSLVDLNFNTGGKIAHFGGAVYGLLFGYYLKNGTNINTVIESFFSALISLFKPKSKLKVVRKNDQRSTRTNPKDTKEIDAILEKIAKSGYDSLSKKEKDFLFKFGKE